MVYYKIDKLLFHKFYKNSKSLKFRIQIISYLDDIIVQACEVTGVLSNCSIISLLNLLRHWPVKLLIIIIL